MWSDAALPPPRPDTDRPALARTLRRERLDCPNPDQMDQPDPTRPTDATRSRRDLLLVLILLFRGLLPCCFRKSRRPLLLLSSFPPPSVVLCRSIHYYCRSQLRKFQTRKSYFHQKIPHMMRARCCYAGACSSSRETPFNENVGPSALENENGGKISSSFFVGRKERPHLYLCVSCMWARVPSKKSFHRLSNRRAPRACLPTKLSVGKSSFKYIQFHYAVCTPLNFSPSLFF